jgi:Na+/H+ antiporter NhaA
MQIYGVAILAGIGFTMSLFIGTLAFSDPSNAAAVRIGVLAGSVISALVGYVLLRATLPAVTVAGYGNRDERDQVVADPEARAMVRSGH